MLKVTSRLCKTLRILPLKLSHIDELNPANKKYFFKILNIYTNKKLYSKLQLRIIIKLAVKIISKYS